MRTIMLDKLDARVLFLPQFEVTIDGGRNDEIRAVLQYVTSNVERKQKGGGEGCVSLCSLSKESSREENQTHRVTTTKFTTSRCIKLL
jgi:hypothetical protein